MKTENKLMSKLRKSLRSFIFGPVNEISAVLNPNRVDFGVTVNADAAIRFTAVFAAIRILSESIASLPKQVSKRSSKGAVPATSHPVFKVLSVKPNEYTDIFTFWFTLMSWILGKGNAYAVIERDNAGRVVALHQAHPDYVRVKFFDGHKFFEVCYPDEEHRYLNGTYLDHEVLHLMYFSINGLKGIDPISYNASAIGRGIATQKFASDFYTKGGNIKGVLEMDNSFDDDSYKEWMNRYNDAASNFETPLLEYGIKYKSIPIDPLAAQMIQSETMSIQDIARIFGIPPHLLAEMSHATFSNIEQQNIYFAVYSLRPLCKRIEQQLENKLFSDAERGRYEVKFDLRGLMRGDDNARSTYYKNGIESGWMTPNEARELEDMVQLDGLDKPRMSLNYVNVGEQPINESKNE